MDELEFPGELKSRPILLGDLVELDIQLSKAYSYCNGLSDEIKDFLYPVLNFASDSLIELCDSQGFPEGIDAGAYVHFVYKA